MRTFLVYLLILFAPIAAFAVDVTVVPDGQVMEEATVEYNPFKGAMLVKSYGFEEDDDRDYDQQPDEWLRREGDEFPSYIKMKIDYDRAATGLQSLRIQANGGMAIYYSPPIRIDDLHSYVFQSRVFCKDLHNDAVMISLSFLNDRRERIQRTLSKPVSGSSDDWQTIQVGPITPMDGVRFAVIGVHLVHSDKMDIKGTAWVDDIWLGKLPRFFLESNFTTHFRQTDTPISVNAHVTGLDSGTENDHYVYQLFLKAHDVNGRLIARRTLLLTPNRELEDDKAALLQKAIAWDIPSQPPGFYRVSSQLQREGQVIMRKETSFVVLDLVKTASLQGEFGLAVPHGADQLEAADFVSIMVESGINWIKYPMWDRADQHDSNKQMFLGSVLSGLEEKGISTVGLLNHPPMELRNKFPSDWEGVSNIFTMPIPFWKYSIDDVMAKYSGNVRIWQLGDDSDKSFMGRSDMMVTLSNIKAEFDRIGRDTNIGVSWDWQLPIPTSERANEFFLALNSQQGLNPEQISDKLRATEGHGFERWVHLTSTPLQSTPPKLMEARASDLVKRMIAAKIGGAEKIFMTDIFDPETGLLREDGSPTELFIPWRTLALALRGSDYLGSMQFPNGSINYIFSRQGQATLVIWNPSSTEESPLIEEMYLGEDVQLTTIWGQRTSLPLVKRIGQRIPVTAHPQILTNVSEALVRFMMSVKFEKGQIPSSTAYHHDAIIGRNTFSTGTSGALNFKPPKEWDVDPKVFRMGLARGEEFRMPFTIKLPASTSLGKRLIPIEFEMEDGQLAFTVYRDYEIGMGDVEISVEVIPDAKNNQLIVEQTIFNNTSPAELLDFRCSLDVRGRRRQYKSVTKLDGGQSIKKTFFVDDPGSLTDFTFKLRAEQVDGRRMLNYTWTPDQISTR